MSPVGPTHPSLYKDVPGQVIVQVTVFQAGDPKYQHTLPNGRVITEGIKLSELRKRFGGDEGELADPMKGQRHRISLKPWATADPNTTYVRVDFALKPNRPIPPQYQHLFDSAPPSGPQSSGGTGSQSKP